MKISVLLIIALLFNNRISFSEVESNAKTLRYDLTKPLSISTLPEILNEVSGITVLDSTTVVCVQDENGTLFIYDVLKNKIKKQYNFHLDGDYEGIAKVGNTIYVLRSDAVLFEISNFQSDNFKVLKYSTGIPADNNEGLCFDEANNRLLIACKSKLGKGPEYKDKRAIYSFDLSSKKTSVNPVYTFDVNAIKNFSREKNINLPVKTKKKNGAAEPVIKFFTSAIAIHPFTNKLFLLSAADHMLFIFDINGNPEHIEVLDPDMFNKAEGISFLNNGDMLITNEAQNKKPTLLRFDYLND